MREEEKLKIEHLNVNELKPYVNNSRTHSNEQIDQICASIKKFGFTSPIIIDESLTVLAGHGRLQAAMKAGLLQVPVVRIIGLTDAEKKAYVIADNKIAENSAWNEDILKIELDEIGKSGIDLSITGLSDDFISKIFDETGGVTIDEDIDVNLDAEIKITFQTKDRAEILNIVNRALQDFKDIKIWCDDEQIQREKDK